MKRTLLSLSLGLCLSLLSTFVGERSATAIYPEVMGCETGCCVVATGWPFVFVRDYTGMSVINTADLSEVIFGADRFDWLPFFANLIFWSAVSYVALASWGQVRSLQRTPR